MEVQENASGEPQVDSVAPEVKEEQSDKVAYESYQKAVGDIKKWKSRYQEQEDRVRKLETIVKATEEDKLQKEGRFDDLIVSLKEENSKLSRTLVEKDSLYGLVQTQYAIKEEAAKQGCTDTEVLMRLLDRETLNGIELEEGYRPRSEQVKELVEGIKKKTDHLALFKKEPIRLHDANVRGSVVGEAKSIDDMDLGELEAILTKLKN